MERQQFLWSILIVLRKKWHISDCGEHFLPFSSAICEQKMDKNAEFKCG